MTQSKDEEIEKIRLDFIGVWDFIGRNGPKIFDEIHRLQEENKLYKQQADEGREYVEGLKAEIRDFQGMAEKMLDPEFMKTMMESDIVVAACKTLKEVQAERDRLKTDLERKHEHCVTPCQQIEATQANHSSYLLMKERAEIAEAEVSRLKAKLKEWEDGNNITTPFGELAYPTRERMRQEIRALSGEIIRLKAQLAEAVAEAYKTVARQIVHGYPKDFEYNEPGNAWVRNNRWMIHDWCLEKATEALSAPGGKP